MFHAFLGEQIDSAETCSTAIKKILENTSIPYITITPTFSICPDHGYIAGENFTCPTCGKDAEVWTRIVGFHRPVQSWNKGKQEEYKERKEFDIVVSLKHVGQEEPNSAQEPDQEMELTITA